MILREHVIKCGNVSTWNLRPFGDLQFGTKGFKEDLWNQWVKETREDPFALTIGMGDLTDNWRPTAQTKLEIAVAGDADFRETLEDMHKKHMMDVFRKIAPAIRKDRCLGFLAGHHDFVYKEGISSTQWLCERLNVPYLDRMAYIKLLFENNKTKTGHRWLIKIHAQHGDGGAAFTGTDIANLERRTKPYWTADLFLRGHSTKRWAIQNGRYDMTKSNPPKLVYKDELMVNTGGFMSGYVEDSETYVSKKNMPPINLGYVVVHIKLERHRPNIEEMPGENFKLTCTQ